MKGKENKFKLNECVYFIKHDSDGFAIQQGYISRISLDDDDDIVYDIREDRFNNCTQCKEQEIFSSDDEARDYISNNVLKKWTKYCSYDY